MSVQYKCDRCGIIMKPEMTFTVEIEPPTVFRYYRDLATYYVGTMHFCSDCMGKIYECIDELGRNE